MDKLFEKQLKKCLSKEEYMKLPKRHQKLAYLLTVDRLFASFHYTQSFNHMLKVR